MTFQDPTLEFQSTKIVLISVCIVYFNVVQSKITPTQCNSQIPARACHLYADCSLITVSSP
jgi:hypothetical protein